MSSLGLYLLQISSFLSVTFFLKVFFYLYNIDNFTEFSFWQVLYGLLWGLRFDLALAFLCAFPLCVFNSLFRIKKNFFGFVCLLLSISVVAFLQLADAAYFSESGRHLTFDASGAAGEAQALALSAVEQFLSVTILFLFVVGCSFVVGLKFLKNIVIRYNSRLRETITLFVVAVFTFLFIRGGVYSLPMSNLTAYEIGQPKLGLIALNGGYSFLRSAVQKSKFERQGVKKLSQSEITKNLQELYQERVEANFTKKKINYNVVFILLESWSASAMSSYGYHRQTTPFFDSLRKRSLSTQELIAGGHRTSEGMFCAFCSAQNPLGGSIANSSLQDFEYECLPQIFRQKGWSTNFFVGTHRNTTGVGALAQKLGFRHSYGKEDISDNKIPHNNWGVHDEDLYDFVFSKIKKIKHPFFIGINTNSTHDETLPKGFKTKFPIKDRIDIRDNLLYYSDTALKKLVEKIEKDQSIAPTLFVLMADHTSGLQKSTFDHYRIPFLIYKTRSVYSKKHDLIVSQRDIAPTVLDMLSWESPQSFSGNSLLRPYKSRFVDYYHEGVLGWVVGKRVVEISALSGEILSCNNYNNWKLMPAKCNDKDQREKQKALSFTNYSQNLLFSGKLKKFRRL
jgi:phosphoglycerol transferase MdoB-like AlkP superfamily enzyme